MPDLPDHLEPILILTGTLIRDSPDAAAGQLLLALDDAHAVTAPAEYGALLEFLTRPRVRSDVEEWARLNDERPELIDELITAKRLLQVDPGDPDDVLACFAGHRVIPEARPVEVPHPAGLVYIRRGDHGPTVPISPLLAQAIWFANIGEDLPATISRLTAGRRTPDLSRLAIGGLGQALAARLVRVEVTPELDPKIRGLLTGSVA